MDNTSSSNLSQTETKLGSGMGQPVICAGCGTVIPTGHEIVLQGKSKQAPRVIVCSNCAHELERVYQAETEAPNWPGALLVGLGAALLATLIWYGVVVVTNYQLGIVAIAVGWLVAQGVMRGAGGKRGPQLQALSVAITLLALVVSEYFIVRHFVVQALSEEGYTDFRIFLPLGDMIEIVIEGIKAEPMTLLFWGIALWEAFIIPAQRRLRRATV